MGKDLDLLQSEEGLFFGTFNDVIIKNHDMKLIEGAEKIAQDIVKILLITKGSHLLFPNYGTLIATYINGRKTKTVDENIINEIVYALTYVKQMNGNEAINIDTIQSVKVNDNINGFVIVLNILLTNGELLTIKRQYVEG